MDKATEMGKISTLGSVQLFFGTSISTVIRAIGTIVLGIIILPGDYGLYAVALIPATTLAVFQDWGIGSSLVRFCAKYRSTNDQVEQRRVIVAGMVFEVATGLVLTVLSFLLASFFTNFFALSASDKTQAAFLIAFASVTMLSGSIASGVASVFTGFEQMKLNSYMLIVSAVMSSLTAPVLVYFGYRAFGAIIGYTLASVVQAVISIVLLYFLIFRRLRQPKSEKLEVVRTLKLLLNYGVPLGIGNLVSNLVSPVFNFLMAAYVTTVMIGNYKIAGNFAILLTFLTGPISTVLFPAFSKLDPKNEKSLLKLVYASSIKYTVLLVVPATMAMIVLANPLIGTLYGNKWPSAPIFLALSVIYNLLALFGLRSMGGFLSALGETKLLLKLSLLTLIISVPVAFLLVPSFGIIGIIVGSPASALPSTFIGLYLTWKHYGAKADFGASAKIFFASALSAAAVYLFLLFFKAPYWIQLIAGSILFLVIYVVSSPLVGAITQSDLNSLRTLFSGLGKVSVVLEIPLKIIQKILKARNSNAETRSKSV